LGTTAIIIAVFYSAVSALGIAFMWFIARSTRDRGAREPQSESTLHRLRETEKQWFVVVIVLLVALFAGTIFFTPYGRSAGSDAQVLEVQALQFAWVIPSTPVKAGREVEFRLISKDVNHSFAVYTAGGKLLFQVQVMPDRTQTYVYTFEKPGTYHVLCLEYCGVDHDKMQSEITVTAVGSTEAGVAK
jgi:cytochrome c oxidase subunit 2